MGASCAGGHVGAAVLPGADHVAGVGGAVVFWVADRWGWGWSGGEEGAVPDEGERDAHAWRCDPEGAVCCAPGGAWEGWGDCWAELECEGGVGRVVALVLFLFFLLEFLYRNFQIRSGL
jgi:hypothetical protein